MNKDTTTVKMLTINQAAQSFQGLTRFRIREMCISGEIPCIKAGRKYLICEQVLAQYLTKPQSPLPNEPLETIRPINN